MDDELEKLLTELADQEREKLRRKSTQHINTKGSNSVGYKNGMPGYIDATLKPNYYHSQFQKPLIHGITSHLEHSKQIDENANSEIFREINLQQRKISPSLSYIPYKHNYPTNFSSFNDLHSTNYNFATFSRPGKFEIFPFSRSLFFH